MTAITFADVLRTLDAMRADGVIQQYAITGAVALSMWAEPVGTDDLDVAVIVSGEPHPLDPLRSVFEWLRVKGFRFQGEHVEIGGVPVQFLTDDPVLLREAIEAAVEIPYDETLQPPVMMRLVTPTYLAALWLLPSANTPVRRERTARLREASLIDDDLLGQLRERHRL